MEEIVNANKMIAEFMGATDHMMDLPLSTIGRTIVPSGKLWFKDRNPDNMHLCKIDELKYHTSWDWLMDVVEKIEKGARVDIYGKACKISQAQWTVDIAHINESKLTAVWICVVEFIKWLNSSNGTPTTP